jgi:hypothetical protein
MWASPPKTIETQFTEPSTTKTTDRCATLTGHLSNPDLRERPVATDWNGWSEATLAG